MTTIERVAPDIPRRFRAPQFRSATCEEVDLEQRTVLLRAVPYDHEVQLSENLRESFEPGAFARAAKDPARVKLWLGHSTHGGSLAGHAIEIEDRSDGSWIQARVSGVQAGADLLTLLEEGTLDEASVEFHPIRDAMRMERRGEVLHVRHLRAHLRGVALVPHGAYGRMATVASVRDDDQLEKLREAEIARLRALDG